MDVYKRIFDHSVGSILKEVIAGGSNGSLITLSINDCRIFISCAWRLFKNEVAITGWHEESIEQDSPLVSGIKKIEGLRFTSYAFHSPFDFDLCFEDGFTLSVFADNTSMSEVDENWTVCDVSSNKCYTLSNEYILIAQVFQ